jgi:hypothetical protein
VEAFRTVMTNDKLEAGSELDEFIVEKVMMWKHLPTCHGWHPPENTVCHFDEVPDYSTDMRDAWKVVEQLKSYRWSITLDIDFATGYSVRLLKYLIPIDNSPEIFVEAKTMPLAICQAALEAVKYDKR